MTRPPRLAAGAALVAAITVYYPAGVVGTMRHAGYVDPLLATTLQKTWGVPGEQYLKGVRTSLLDGGSRQYPEMQSLGPNH